MVKRAINAKQAVADIRSGMDDAALMNKHHLSAEGLQSLLDKLVKGGFIDLSEIAGRLPGFLGVVRVSEAAPSRHRLKGTDGSQALQTKSPPLINAQEAARDIRWGIADSALMSKYHLSSTGLSSLFDKLLSSGLITEADLDRRDFLADHTVNLKEEMLSFTDALDQLGLNAPKSATGDEGVKPKRAKVRRTLNERTEAAEPISPRNRRETSQEEKVSSGSHRTPWYDRPAIVMLLLVGLFPLGLYTLCQKSTFSIRVKLSMIVGWALLATIYLMIVMRVM
ncbi:MAG: hypothetical protein WBG50_09060 [Desulfomonilaceae bacterium]